MSEASAGDDGMLVLFDIDGTLLLSKGAGARAMQAAGRRVVGPNFTLADVEFAGRLDPLIWAEAAHRAGIDGDEAVHRRFRAAYAEELERRLSENPTSYPLPGVLDLLARLRSLDDVTLGLVTGNYPETGRLKLTTAGIDPEWFAVAAWGSDGSSRRDLPPVALERCVEATGRVLGSERVVVVGDTIHDVDCARAHGCRSLAVGTGPGFTMDELRASGPDLLLADLTQTDAVVRWLCQSA